MKVLTSSFLVLVLGGLVAGYGEASPWGGFMGMALSPDATEFVTGGRHGEVLRFDVATGEVLGRWQVSPFPVVGLAFSEKSGGLGVITLDGKKAWLVPDVADPVTLPPDSEVAGVLDQALQQWLAAPPPAQGVRVAGGGLVVRGFPDGHITVSPSVGGATLATWSAHDAAVTGLALVPDGSLLLSCAYDGTLRCWDPRTGRSLGHL